jgi:hypothetical protein
MQNTLEDLRNILFETIENVKTGKVDVEKARMINDLAKTINDQAGLTIKAAETFGSVSGGDLFKSKRLTS